MRQLGSYSFPVKISYKDSTDIIVEEWYKDVKTLNPNVPGNIHLTIHKDGSRGPDGAVHFKYIQMDTRYPPVNLRVTSYIEPSHGVFMTLDSSASNAMKSINNPDERLFVNGFVADVLRVINDYLLILRDSGPLTKGGKRKTRRRSDKTRKTRKIYNKLI